MHGATLAGTPANSIGAGRRPKMKSPIRPMPLRGSSGWRSAPRWIQFNAADRGVAPMKMKEAAN